MDIGQATSEAVDKTKPNILMRVTKIASFFPPIHQYESWRHLILHMEHLLANHSPIPISPIIAESFDLHPPSTRLSGLFDGIFVINLRHRPNRRRRLEHVFREWGIEAEFLDAVDGRNVTSRDVDRLGMRKLKEFKCPFTGRWALMNITVNYLVSS